MTELATARAGARPWPMTSEAAESLGAEIQQARRDIAALAGEGLEEGVANLRLAQSLRRLEALLATQGRAQLLDDPGCAAIGRKATVQHPNGDVDRYAIVYPGDGNPARSCVSADSPLGSALLGARPGAVVQVAAPGGTWTAAVLSVE